jgi:hypothetical protein
MSPLRLQTGPDATTLELGEIKVGKGRMLAGRVILSDGKTLGPTAEMVVQCLVSRTALRRQLDPAGRFRFDGLPDGPVAVFFDSPAPPDQQASSPLAGYHLSLQNSSIDAESHAELLGMIDRDITDLKLLLDLGEKPAFEPATGAVDMDSAHQRRLDQARRRSLDGVPVKPSAQP